MVGGHRGFPTRRQTGRQESKGKGLRVAYHCTWEAQLSALPSVFTSHFTPSLLPLLPLPPPCTENQWQPGTRADVPTALKRDIRDFNSVSYGPTPKFCVRSVV